jgi:hypothetical protein
MALQVGHRPAADCERFERFDLIQCEFAGE